MEMMSLKTPMRHMRTANISINSIVVKLFLYSVGIAHNFSVLRLARDQSRGQWRHPGELWLSYGTSVLCRHGQTWQSFVGASSPLPSQHRPGAYLYAKRHPEVVPDALA